MPKLLILLSIICLSACTSRNKSKTISHTTYTVLKATNISADTLPGQINESAIIRKTKKEGSYTKDPPIISLYGRGDLSYDEVPVQAFTIRQNSDTTLYCKEGTIINIAKESFETINTNPEIENITVTVKEYYSIADIVLANLTTTSGEQILETGGMLFVEAFCGNEECQLRGGKSLEVRFPVNKKKEGMTTFTGDYVNGKMNWSEASSPVFLQTEQTAEFPGGTGALRKFLEKNIVFPDSLAYNDIGETVLLDFVIDETGNPVDVIVKNKTQQAFRKIVLDTYAKMPRWRPAMQNGKPLRSRFSQTISFLNSDETTFDTVYQKAFEENVKDTTINNLNPEEISYYVLSVSKLGWINCDRLYNDPGPKKDFFVKVDDYDWSDLDIKIVFHSFKSILSGTNIPHGTVFNNIPLDEKVTVIATRKTNDINYIAITEASTSEKIVANLIFEKVTMQQLKQKLEQLSSWQ